MFHQLLRQLQQHHRPHHVYHNQLQKFEDMTEQELELVNPVTLMVRIRPRMLNSKYIYWAALIQGKTNSFAWGSYKQMTEEPKIRGMCRVNGWGLRTYNRRLKEQDFVVVSSGANFKGMLKDILVMKDKEQSKKFSLAFRGLAKKAGQDITMSEKNLFNRSAIHKGEISKRLAASGVRENDTYVSEYLDTIVARILDYIVRNKRMQEPTEKYCMDPDECQIRPSEHRAKHKWGPREFNEYLACSQWTYGSSMFEQDDDIDRDSFHSDDNLMPDEESIL